MLRQGVFRVADFSYRTLLIVIAAVLAVAFFATMFTHKASAAQLTSRKVTLSSSKISDTGVTYTFAFTPSAATTIQSIDMQFCTTPLGTCTQPTGLSTASYTIGAQTFTGATAFTAQTTNTGGCTVATLVGYEVCVKRTDATSETVAAKSLAIGGMVNMSTQSTVYVRITTYTDNAFATSADTGVVAGATARQLTVSGRVQERLEFCVAGIDDAASMPANCSSAPSTTSVDIGNITNSAISVAPVNVSAANGTANDYYGMAQVSTNAGSGTVIQYFPATAGSGTNQLTSFRVTGASCNASNSNLTDQCFQNAATTGTTFSAGTEDFGMYIPCVDTTQGTTTNLGAGGGSVNGTTLGTINSGYSGTDATITSATDCENEASATKFAWDTSSVNLISSSSVVDNEIVKMRFGATAQATTPTGAYSVTINYIATPTF